MLNRKSLSYVGVAASLLLLAHAWFRTLVDQPDQLGRTSILIGSFLVVLTLQLFPKER